LVTLQIKAAGGLALSRLQHDGILHVCACAVGPSSNTTACLPLQLACVAAFTCASAVGRAPMPPHLLECLLESCNCSCVIRAALPTCCLRERERVACKLQLLMCYPCWCCVANLLLERERGRRRERGRGGEGDRTHGCPITI
jgi:hypothetical protein